MEIYKNINGLKYIEYRPNDFKENKKYPVILYLHGSGERGDAEYDKLKIHGPIKVAESGKLDLQFIIISPQCALEKTWFDYGERLSALSNSFLETPYMDEKRIYLTGNSMGGYGAWALASSIPENFSAVAPICGGGMPWLTYKLKKMPVWAFHCRGDQAVELYENEKMINALKKISESEVKFTVYPRDDHDAWTETYENPKFYEWLLTKTR